MNKLPIFVDMNLLKMCVLFGTIFAMSGCRDSVTYNSLVRNETLTVKKLTPSESSSQTFYSNTGSGFGEVLIELGVDFSAGQICEGKSILGIIGTRPCQQCSTAVFSTKHRKVGSLQIETQQEGLNIPTPNYHNAPKIRQDDDGVCTNDVGSTLCLASHGLTPVKPVTLSTHRTFAPCGNSSSFATIDLRAAHCFKLNGYATIWDGRARGSGGESLWRLITVSDNLNSGLPAFFEVWQDTKTGLLWSSRSAAPVPNAPTAVGATNPKSAAWCAASGNSEGDTLATPNCGTAGTPVTDRNITSYCAETEALSASGTSFPGDDFLTNPSARTYDGAKGRMGRDSTPSVFWRLPTLNDYHQADIDGIRFVMPDMGGIAYKNAGNATEVEWTATIDSSLSDNAFVYSSVQGLVQSLVRNSETAFVRCVGRY